MSFQLYFLFFITLLSTVPNINTKASPGILKNNEAVRYLITSSTGMQFQKIDNSQGSLNLTYDCSVGVNNKGVVDVYDNVHPINTKSITIENCENITLRICHEGIIQGWIKSSLEELLVKNVNTVNFFTGCESDYNGNMFYNRRNNYLHPYDSRIETTEDLLKNSKRFYINNVENLELLERSCLYFPNVILSIENTTIGKLYRKAISSGVATLKLQNVKINAFEENGIYLNSNNENFDPVLIIKDCRFGNVDRNIIFVKGSEVEISNNSFQFLQDNIFTINATKKFTFSDNYIRKMNAPFNVWSSNIHITGNTFDMIKAPWVAGLRVSMRPENTILHVSQNSMKFYPLHYFAMDPASHPDIITFESNSFNCTCQNWDFDGLENSKIGSYLLQKTKSNVCANLGNCPLWKAMRHMDEICDDTFNCSEAEKPEISSRETYLQMILSTLNDIKATLHSLASKDKVLTFSNELNKTGEESVTIGPVEMVP